MNDPRITFESPSTVLVIESNPHGTLLLQVIAEKLCPDVAFVFVPDLPQAMAYLKGEARFTDRQVYPFPTLVLPDLGMVGKGALDQIRHLPESQKLKVLSWRDRFEPGLPETLVPDDVVPRPSTFTQLLEDMARICSLARQSAG